MYCSLLSIAVQDCTALYKSCKNANPTHSPSVQYPVPLCSSASSRMPSLRPSTLWENKEREKEKGERQYLRYHCTTLQARKSSLCKPEICVCVCPCPRPCPSQTPTQNQNQSHTQKPKPKPKHMPPPSATFGCAAGSRRAAPVATSLRVLRVLL